MRPRIFEEVSPRDRFEVAVEDSQRLLRPLDDTHFDLIEHRYGHIRQFAPAVLENVGVSESEPRGSVRYA